MRFMLLFSIFIILLIAISGCTAWQIEKKHPAIGKFIEVDGQQLHYVELGSENFAGPPLVLLHGSSANLNDTKIALGDELAERSRVILFDRPGRGYSTRPKNGYLLDVQAQLIHKALKKMGVEKPILIGQSLGGSVALAYTLRYQNDMSGAVLLAPASHEWPGDVVWYNKLSSNPFFGLLLRRTIVPYYGRVVAKNSVNGTFWPQAAPEDYYERVGIALLFRPKEFKNNADDVVHLKSQIIEMSKRYSEISIPTRIFVGTHDTTVSPTIHSYNLAKDIAGAELTILPATGHGLHHTASDEIIAGIEAMTAKIIVAGAETQNVPPSVNTPDTGAVIAGDIDLEEQKTELNQVEDSLVDTP